MTRMLKKDIRKIRKIMRMGRTDTVCLCYAPITATCTLTRDSRGIERAQYPMSYPTDMMCDIS